MLKLVLFLILPLLSGCQMRNSRVAGGDPSERNSRPFQVALYLRVGEEGELGFCGGSLVHQLWLLTAAHCCLHDEQLVDNVQAVLGAHSLYDRYENGRRIVNVAEVVIHPDWDPDTYANDLALLRLANTVQLSDTINVIRLPYVNMAQWNFAGVTAVTSGWGIPASGLNFISPTLREKVMTVMTDPFCNSLYSNSLPNDVICGSNATAGTCTGDNGGPMTFFHTPTEEIILIGVASFVDSSGCNSELPSVFTRTQRYLDWISSTTGIQLT